MSFLNPIESQGAWRPFRDTPVPVPSASIGDSPQFSICFNQAWLVPILTALKAMTRPEFWSAEDADTIRGACVDGWSFQLSEDCGVPISFRNPTPCTLEYSADGGETWSLIFDGDACIRQEIEDGVLSPGSAPATSSGTPGECETFSMVVPSTGAVTVPLLVSTGDTIQVTDLDIGPWIDSIGTMAAFCSDGFGWTFPAGCGAPEPAHENDPLDTANHMALIAKIGDDYYDVSGGALITVPSGVADAAVILQPNDDILWDNLFSIHCNIEVCNSHWVHVFDFTADDGGFAVRGGFQGTYVPGVGWETDYLTGGGGQEQFVIYVPLVASAQIIEYIAIIDMPTAPDVATGMSCWTGSGFTTNFDNLTVNLTGVNSYDKTPVNTLVTDLTLVLNGYHYASAHHMTLQSLTIRGVGTDPF